MDLRYAVHQKDAPRLRVARGDRPAKVWGQDAELNSTGYLLQESR